MRNSTVMWMSVSVFVMYTYILYTLRQESFYCRFSVRSPLGVTHVQRYHINLKNLFNPPLTLLCIYIGIHACMRVWYISVCNMYMSVFRWSIYTQTAEWLSCFPFCNVAMKYQRKKQKTPTSMRRQKKLQPPHVSCVWVRMGCFGWNRAYVYNIFRQCNGRAL